MEREIEWEVERGIRHYPIRYSDHPSNCDGQLCAPPPVAEASAAERGSRDEQTGTSLRAHSALVERAAAAISARWKLPILCQLVHGPRRRAELERVLPEELSAKVLTEQLRALEADGLIVRRDLTERRRHVVYALSPLGEGLRESLELFATWSLAFGGHHDGSPTNASDRMAGADPAGRAPDWPQPRSVERVVGRN
jgi:DNA-binding HxlR family transcriptional regulator